MADLVKKATRESYGEALAALGDKYENSMSLTPTLPAPPRPASLRKSSRTGISTAESQRRT